MRTDYLLGRLKQLQIRFPRFISDVRRGELVMDVEFYLEDVAIDAAQTLLDHGVTAVHRMDRPKVVCLQLPSVFEQHQDTTVVELLYQFLHEKTKGEIKIERG